MIRILYRRGEQLRTDFPIDKLPEVLEQHNTRIWVDICNEPPDEVAEILSGIFNIHPLAIEDTVHDANLPKIDDWGNYLYMCMQSIEFDQALDETDVDRKEKLDIIKGKHYLITHHLTPIPAIDREWERCLKDSRSTQSGAHRIMYEIMDNMADDFMLVMEKIDDAIDDIESRIFDSPTHEVLDRIFQIKRTVLHLRRVLSPQREVLNKLARDEYKAIDPANRIYYRDVYDHLVRLYEMNESLRDLIGGVMDMYLTVSSNKTNDIMKILTVVATLFMPLTFISGFWGMNFYEPAPNTTWCNPVVMYCTLGLMLLLPIAMLFYMRKRKWL